MNVHDVTEIVIAIALVGFLVYRQTTWQYLDTARIWRAPLILVVIGVVTLSQSDGATTISTADVVFVGAELVVTVAVGLGMGRIAHFRVAQQPNAKGHRVQTRTGGLGAVLWVVLIVVRIGMDVLGTALGAHLLAGTGMVLVMIGVNRAARALVLDQRIPKSVAARA